MPTFVGMLSWTDQGVRTVKDTPKRIQAARERAKKLEFDQAGVPHYGRIRHSSDRRGE